MMKICNQLQGSQISERIWFLRQEPGWSDLILARGQIYPEKSQRTKRDHFGAKKCYLGI